MILRLIRKTSTSASQTILKNRKYRPISRLEKEIKKMLGVTRWIDIKTTLQNPKELVGAAAKKLQIPESHFVKLLAARTGYGFVAVPTSMDLNAIPETMTLEDFDRAGCIASTVGGIISGIVCANPASLSQLGNFYTGSNVQLCVLAEVEKALALTKRQASAKVCAGVAATNNIAEVVLRHIVTEAKSYCATVLTINLADKAATYGFKNSRGRILTGTIHLSAVDALSEILSNSVAEENGFLDVSKDIRLHISVTSLSYTLTIETESENKSLVSGVSNSQPVKKHRAMHVLMVDDSDTFSRVVERFLAKEGVSVARIADGAAAIKVLCESEELPSLIISDVHMPNLDGFEFVRQLKTIEGCQALPIIMLTSDEELETELELVKRGVDTFVSKNKHPEILKAHVLRLLGERRKAA